MLTLIIFVAILGLLVLSHEFGHFIAARRCGMKVEEFGFGFPPKLFGIKRGDTLYSFNWLPLGGFVKIKGENGEAETESDSFMAKPAWQKTIVLASGVVMNILLAAVLLSVGYMFGLPGSTESAPASAIIQDQRVEIIQAMAGKPAQVAGLQAGDAIIKIDALEKPTIKQMQDYLAVKNNVEVAFSIRRGGAVLDKKIKPAYNEDTKRAGIGVAIAEIGIVKYVWYKAIFHGFADAFIFLKEIFVAFYLLVAGLFAGRGAAEAVTGPVGIAVLTGQVARLGFAYLIQFTAMLSLNLALINILPIPALDGGRILFVWLGKIFRKPVFMRFEQLAHTVGFALLMLLVLAVTVKDLGAFKGVFIGLFSNFFN